MDETLPDPEILLQQLEELKKELAKKEKRLMKMEKIAQARKRASVVNPEKSLPTVHEEVNDDLRQNVSASYISTGSSLNDVFPDANVLSSQKDKYCSKDYCNNVPQGSASSACEYQKECASSAATEDLSWSNIVLPHESTGGNKSKCTSTCVSPKITKEFADSDLKNVPATNVYGHNLAFNADSSSVKISESKLAKEISVVSNINLVKNSPHSEFYTDTQVDVPSEIFCTGLDSFVSNENIKCKTSSVDLSISSHNLNKAKKSLPLEVSSSFQNNIAIQQVGFLEENVCIKDIFPGECEKSKIIQDTIEMRLEEDNTTGSKHFVALVPKIDTHNNECPKYISRSADPLQKCKDRNLRSDNSKETLKFAEHVDDKSLGGEYLLKNTKANSKVDVDEKVQQNIADISNYSGESSSSEVYPPRSFRRSQRLAKQNSAVAYEKKFSASNKDASVISSLFEWFIQKCRSSDVTYFELPPEEFGLLVEIKIKNSNHDAWPPSPSESFEMLTSEEFVPDSEEDKNPYCHSPKRLFSSLSIADSKYDVKGSYDTSECFSDSFRKMLLDERSPNKMLGDQDKGLAYEYLAVDATQNSSKFIPCTPDKLQKSPEKPVIHDERQSPFKSKHFEQQVVLETEDLDLDLVDTGKTLIDETVCNNSPTVSKCVNSDVTCSVTSEVKRFNSGNVSLSYATQSNHDKCNMDEDMEQLDISLTDLWSPLNTSNFGFHSVNKPADKSADIVSPETKGSQRKLFVGNDYQSTDLLMPCRPNTITDEPLPDVNNYDAVLQSNLYPEDGDCNGTIEVNHDKFRNLSFLCCLETENKEPVKRIHTLSIGSDVLIAVQCDSIIEIWKKVLVKEWTKLGIYKTENMTSIEKSCVLSNGKYVIFILLVCSNGRQSLKFLAMDADLQVIQVMENDSFEQNSNRTRITLCGLEGLTFVTAEGTECCSVDIHFVEASSGPPFLISRKLSNVQDCLLGLFSVQNAQKGVLGLSMECIYIWNYVSGNLVTTVNLVPKPLKIYSKCLWATSEEGLLFLLLIPSDKNCRDSCHLVAVNPMTGLWDKIQYFQHSSHEEHKTANEYIDGTVLGRHVVLTCCRNSYLWDLYNGSNIASLTDCDVTSVTCGHKLLAVGLQSGCANLYSFH